MAKKSANRNRSSSATRKTAKRSTKKVKLTGVAIAAGEWPVDSVGRILSSDTWEPHLSQHIPGWLEELRAAESRRFETLFEQRFRAEQVLKSCRLSLMELPEVNGVHVGYRRKSDAVAFPLEICIRIHVDTKYANPRDARIQRLFGDAIDGVPVDVLQRRYDTIATREQERAFHANVSAGSDSAPAFAYDPLRGGIAIANEDTLENWGTLGLPVYRNGKLVLLTNAHVVGQASIRYPSMALDAQAEFTKKHIVHPPLTNGPIVGEVNRVENVVRDETMDVAVIEMKDADAQVKLLGPDQNWLNMAMRFGVPSVGRVVFIIGARSGLNTGMGVIRSTNGSVVVRPSHTMNGQILVSPMTDRSLIEPGDSGSLLLGFAPEPLKGLEILGLAHSKGDDGTLVATPIQPIIDRFGISLF